MIGVAVSAAQRGVAEEFFELFKTPWAYASSSTKYRVVLCTDGAIDHLEADVYLVYGSAPCAVDFQSGQTPGCQDRPLATWEGSRLPIYGRAATFGAAPGTLEASGQRLDYSYRLGSRVVRRIGYDLFAEVDHLLSEGQPAAEALTPTLEVHIALLRQLLSESGFSFLEIPPRPHDYRFICCLTHDIDFFGIRRHRFDGTLAGFLKRGIIGTAVELVRGERSIIEALRNWIAVLSLPLVHLGLKKDPWDPFADYARVEKERRSTFFLVPFKGRAGIPQDGAVEPRRAVKYQASEIEAEARKLAAAGSELAVHGLDAWADDGAGRAEMRELLSITGEGTAGVRMHWLYFSKDAPRHLEAAGFEYDSTWGYNDAIGYKAGTSQVFRHPGTAALMELPLSIMDSALFYPNRMALRRQSAATVCQHIISNARRDGGTVVLNWHDRSLAPERQWGDFYRQLLEELGAGDQAWFATARDAVNWFKWRRSLRFSADPQSALVTVTSTWPLPNGPAGSIRLQHSSDAGVRVDLHRLACDESVTVDLQKMGTLQEY